MATARSVVSKRPPTERYNELLKALAIGTAELKGGGDALSVSFHALTHVIRFLDLDPAVMELGITAPLAKLLNAINDLRQGAKPALFKITPRAGRQTNLSIYAGRAAVVLALKTLLDNGESRGAAGRYIAQELRKLGVELAPGKAITASIIHRWRDEVGGVGPLLTTRAYKKLVSIKYLGPPRSPRQLALLYLGTLQKVGF